MGIHGRGRAALAMMSVCFLVPALLGASVTGMVTSGHAGILPPRFSVRSLGVLPYGTSSSATGINDRGEVTGYGQTYRPHYAPYTHPDEAFVWKDGKLRVLGLPNGAQESFGVAINDSGTVAVTVEQADRQGHQVAYLARMTYGRVIWRRLPVPRSRYPYGSPSGINDSGTVVGQSPAVGGTHAATWSISARHYRVDRSWVSLRNTSALGGIDKQGDIVGTDFGSTGQIRHALVWVGQKQPIVLSCLQHSGPPVRCLKWTPADGLGIVRSRNSVLIVGQTYGSVDRGDNRAVVWTLNLTRKGIGRSPRRTVLPFLSGYSLSTATAVDSRGWVIGHMGRLEGGYSVGNAAGARTRSYAKNEVPGPAALWVGGMVYDLNRLIPKRSGWTLEQAAAINSRGQIVGTGLYKGQPRAFLLTPK